MVWKHQCVCLKKYLNVRLQAGDFYRVIVDLGCALVNYHE